MKKNIFLVGLLLIILACSVGAAPKTTTIRYTRWAGTDEATSFQILVNTFMKQNPDIKVETEFLPWNAYWDKLRTTIISGQAADVISFSCNMSAPYVTKSALYDMTKLSGAKKLLEEMQPGTKAAVLYKNKVYGMPVGCGVRALVYNKAMFDEAGVPYLSNTKPITWDEFLKISKKLTKVDSKGNVTQYAAHFHKMEMWESLVIQAGGEYVDNYTRPTKVLLNTPEGITGIQFMLDMIKAKAIPPWGEEWNGPWGTPDSAVATKKVAIMHTGPWGLGPLYDAKINFGTAPLFMNKKRSNRGYINFLAMSKDTKNAAAAWKFIKWMCSEKGQLEFTKTGDLPANMKALEASKKIQIQPAEIMNAFYAELPYVVTGPMVPTDEFQTMSEQIMQDLCQDRITAKEAARRIEEQGNKLIKKIYAD